MQRLHIYLQRKIKAGFHIVAIDLQSLPSSLQKKKHAIVEIELISISAIVVATIAIISGCDRLDSDHMDTSRYQPIFSSIYGPIKRQVRMR